MSVAGPKTQQDMALDDLGWSRPSDHFTQSSKGIRRLFFKETNVLDTVGLLFPDVCQIRSKKVSAYLNPRDPA